MLRKKNATINEIVVTLSISPYRNCVLVMKSQFSEGHEWIFICEFKSYEDYKNETITPIMKFSNYSKNEKFYSQSCERENCILYFYVSINKYENTLILELNYLYLNS